MFIKQTIAPSYEPISLTEAKLHLKVSDTTDDTLITNLIKAAREFVEEYTGRQLMAASWVLYMDDFRDVTYLNIAPIQSFISIRYYSTSSVSSLLDSSYYDVDIVSEPARVTLAYAQTWPIAYTKTNAVQMTLYAGYSELADTEAAQQAAVPADIKQAMLLMIEHNYDNRGDEGHRKYPQAIYDLLDKKRLFWL